jgi:hypothetical protein
MIIHECNQYDDTWWEVRKGIPTASRANKVLTPKGALSSQSRAMVNELIADRLGLGDPPIEATEWMLRGLELEPEARRFFEFETGLPTIEVGFITDDNKTVGCSPDSLIPFAADLESQFKAGLEIKCPKASTQIGYLLGGDLPDYYRPQIHWSMAVTGLKTWWFLSYFPELEPLIVECVWDEYTDAIKTAMEEFTINLNTARQTLGV